VANVNRLSVPMVERVYPLNETGEAVRHLIEDRPLGKVVLTW
jgi:NADPH:quinone reductase